MNNLSWLLYFTDVLYNFSDLVGAISFFGSFVWLMLCLFYPLWCHEEHKDFKPKILVTPFVILLTLWTVLCFVPEKETLYLIAASEAGETVINTPEAQEVFDDLKEILQIQLENLKKPN